MRSLIVATLAVCLSTAASAQSWEGNYYRLRLMKEDADPTWTIHGLWPEWPSASHGECRPVVFNESKIADLLPELNKVWPSDKGPAEDFWTHEWKKHGSCADHMDEHQYFSTALKLYNQVQAQCPHAGSYSNCNFCWVRNLTAQCGYVLHCMCPCSHYSTQLHC